MMILVLIFGGGLGWATHRARVQGEAIARIERQGGVFVFDDEVDDEGYNRLVPERVRPAWKRWLIRNLGEDLVRRPRILFLTHHPGAGSPGETWRAMMDLPELASIRLDAVAIDDGHLASIGRFRRLRHLAIVNCDRVTDVGVAHIGEMSQLHSLDLSWTRTGDGAMPHLANLARLQSLDLSATRVTDAGTSHLRGLHELRDLDLGSTRVGDAGVANLRGLRRLRSLGLDGTRISDSGLAFVADLDELEVLFLHDTDVGDIGMSRISSLDRLWGLGLARTRVGDASLPHLLRLRRLRDLSLSGSRASVEGIGTLKAAFPTARIR